jgi:type I restriction enzyme S subunit
MTNDAKHSVTPKLRFPDFRKAEGWKPALLGNLIHLEYGESLPEQNRRLGPIPVVGSSGVVGHHNEALIKGPAIVVGRKGSVGKVSWINSDCFPIDTTFYVENKIPRENSMQFLYRLLHVCRLEQRSDPSAVPGLNRDGVHSLKVATPKSAEQQKITECLSTLDELIGAESQKLDALKAHKKGLMQQLFPREGETFPRLRFPDFRRGRTWHLKEIGLMLQESPRPIEMADERKYSLVTVKRRYGGVVSREILTGREILVKSQFRVRRDDFLISKRQIVHNACGLVPAHLDGCIVSNEYSVLTAKKGCDIEFFNYFSQQPCVSESFTQCSVGIVIEKMLFKLDSWLKRKFLFPSYDEQRRIASCLSSLDNLIAAQSDKLEALKTHKKGLMQQLFPSPADAEA